MKRRQIEAIFEAVERLHIVDRKTSARDLLSVAYGIDPDICLALIREAANGGSTVLALLGVQFAYDVMPAINAGEFLIEVWERFEAGSHARNQLIDPSFVALRLARIAIDPVIADDAPSQCDLAYVLAGSLPHDATGYAHRSHALVKALTALGVGVTCLTRPGFPWSRGVWEKSSCNQFDGLTYHRTGDAKFRVPVTVADFLRNEEAMLHAIHKTRPRIVMAASNYQTALPALFAARRVGLPFIYEVRGLWELSRSVREPGYCKTDRFRKEAGLEAATAIGADQVFAISPSIRDELKRRGVPVERIGILPNAASLTRLHPRPKDPAIMARLGLSEQTTVIGYVGSFTKYEGLDDLIHACAHLARSDIEFTLLIAGWDQRRENIIGPEIIEMARSMGIEDRLIMLGKISHDEVPAVYSVIDIAPIPRKNFVVTQLVPPLKVIEAMAMGKSVIVSDLLPLREIVGEGAACIFPAGDPVALSRILSKLCVDPNWRQRLGRAARQRIEAHYSWPELAEAFWKKITTELDITQQNQVFPPTQVDVAGQVV